MSANLTTAISLAVAEAERARAKHGDSIEGTHVPQYERLGILVEEVGEVARAINEATLAKDEQTRAAHLAHVREELAQVAACALRWLAVEVGGVNLLAEERDRLRAERDALAAKLEEVTRERNELGPALVIAQQIRAKNVTPEVVAGYEMLQAAVSALMLSADEGGIKNYVEITLAGARVPFDRAAICLIRPGGRTPHEMREQAERERDARPALTADEWRVVIRALRSFRSDYETSEPDEDIETASAIIGKLGKEGA